LDYDSVYEQKFHLTEQQFVVSQSHERPLFTGTHQGAKIPLIGLPPSVRGFCHERSTEFLPTLSIFGNPGGEALAAEKDNVFMKDFLIRYISSSRQRKLLG
jgi:hypothetical protein